MADSEERKQVPVRERRALARAVVHLLNQRDEFGKKVWSQQRLGARLGGLTQEALRRAMHPEGVGPTVREHLPSVFELSIEQLVEQFGDEGESRTVLERAVGQLVMAQPAKAGAIIEASRDLALDHPDLADVEKAKVLIMSLVADAKGKGVGVKDTVASEPRLGRKRSE